jgi:hypothetical protein
MADRIDARPTVENIGDFTGFLSPDLAAEQQQQQQQQQQQARKRFLNLETMLPEEEVVTRLTTEIKTFNQLMPRDKR